MIRRAWNPLLRMSLLCLIGLVGHAITSAAVARASTSATDAQHDGVTLPVWALLDGDTPVSGARVDVYVSHPSENGGSRRRRLRPLKRTGQERTYDSGVALLEFARLPRAFTVVVSGGQAEGRALRGSLSAQVRGYRPGTVVHVTPVTALIERWQRADPTVNRAHVKASVHRALGIPRWADDIDLRATDRWFDGDTFLVRAHGRLDRAIPDLLDDIRRGERARFREPSERPAADVEGDDQPAGFDEWWEEQDLQKLLLGGFQDLGLSLARSGAEAGGKWLIGKLLDEWGLKDVKDFLLPRDSTEVMLELLGTINRKVTELQASVESTKQAVAESQYSVLVGLTNPQTAAIDQITEELAFVAKTPVDEPTRVKFTKAVVGHIEKQLVDTSAAALLHRALDNPAPDTNDILKAASQVYATRRFFTPASSARVQAVYDYFALMQFRLAVLLTNYWTTQPDTYSQDTIQRYIDGIDTSIKTQRTDRLKAALPSGTFIDTRTLRMWPLRSWALNGADALNTVASWQPRSCTGLNGRRPTCTGSGLDPYPLPLVSSTSRPMLGPWADWHFPTEEDFKGLIDGWVGDSPLEWLNKQAGFATTRMSPENNRKRLSGHMWLSDSFRPRFSGLYLYRVNLSEPDQPGPHVWNSRAGIPTNRCDPRTPGGSSCTGDPPDLSDLRTNYSADMMIWRSTELGTYWWLIGGR